MPITKLTPTYFQAKPNGIHLLNLVTYLDEIDANESVVYKHKTLLRILRKGMKKFVKSHPEKREVEIFKQTLIKFTIDGLRSTPLYEINMGILVMCTVERLLYPHESCDFYTSVYGCGQNSAVKYYRVLCDLPEKANVDSVTATSARSFFKTETFTRPRANVEILRTYVSTLTLDEEAMRSIRSLSIHAIRGDAVDDIPLPPENLLPMESDEASASTQGAAGLNSIDPDNSTEDSDRANDTVAASASAPLLIPPAPVYSENHGFTRKYFPGQVILACSSDNSHIFWPAHIEEVYDDRIKVTFYSLRENHVLISNINDIKPFERYEIVAIKRALKDGLTLKFFINAVTTASEDLKNIQLC
ncbi:hypothetical protein TKK_0015262 [Trichogramma kaykai]|uniref:Uncharacterized protein n=1 Tax=Trichogramma kaykai TaxID=54128 RepID=A0ABD2W9X4_9HYME